MTPDLTLKGGPDNTPTLLSEYTEVVVRVTSQSSSGARSFGVLISGTDAGIYDMSHVEVQQGQASDVYSGDNIVADQQRTITVEAGEVRGFLATYGDSRTIDITVDGTTHKVGKA